ncbi:MAG: SRPBCC domain-containing protein [Betaproteobacteria bacterium]|nr:SRPBCC domain-containing protein [Betaproteobacteria bacterium]
MTERTVQHSTIVVERRYDASPARVFAAWADAAGRSRWDVPGDDWELAEHEQDFRVGGREASRFGPKGDPRYSSEGRYLDIVPNARIISAGTMHDAETRTSTTLCTIELIADDRGTRVILTDQSAFLDGREKPSDRESGWGAILNKLEAYLRRNG